MRIIPLLSCVCFVHAVGAFHLEDIAASFIDNNDIVSSWVKLSEFLDHAATVPANVKAIRFGYPAPVLPDDKMEIFTTSERIALDRQLLLVVHAEGPHGRPFGLSSYVLPLERQIDGRLLHLRAEDGKTINLTVAAAEPQTIAQVMTDRPVTKSDRQKQEAPQSFIGKYWWLILAGIALANFLGPTESEPSQAAPSGGSSRPAPSSGGRRRN